LFTRSHRPTTDDDGEADYTSDLASHTDVADTCTSASLPGTLGGTLNGFQLLIMEFHK